MPLAIAGHRGEHGLDGPSDAGGTAAAEIGEVGQGPRKNMVMGQQHLSLGPPKAVVCLGFVYLKTSKIPNQNEPPKVWRYLTLGFSNRSPKTVKQRWSQVQPGMQPKNTSGRQAKSVCLGWNNHPLVVYFKGLTPRCQGLNWKNQWRNLSKV